MTLEQLVPIDHLLRKVDTAIEVRFIREMTEGLYCTDNGHPQIAPEMLFKALFVGCLFGIRSERQRLCEIKVNVAYRWFIVLRLTDRVFDASTFGQTRRRFDGTDIAQRIFDHVEEQAIAQGLVGGEVLYTDSTHLKANANKGCYDKEEIAKSRAAYWNDLDSAATADRPAQRKKPLGPKDRQSPVKATKVSRTDPDAGYSSAPLAKGLEDCDILGVTGYLRPSGPKGMLPKRAFQYNADIDADRCPEGQVIRYATLDRNGDRHDKSDSSRCRDCLRLASCTTNAKAEKTVTCQVCADAHERTDVHRLIDWGKALYKRRKETVEWSLADAKQFFGHRYAGFRSLAKAQTLALLAATAQNIKKIAMLYETAHPKQSEPQKNPK